VIASSTFTAGAIQAANAVGCQLIDGRQIHPPIRGHRSVRRGASAGIGDCPWRLGGWQVVRRYNAGG
jgi:hypothetical protein